MSELVERVARIIAVRQTANGFKAEVLEQDLVDARSIIEEVADAMEEAFKSGEGVNPVFNEGLVWADWLRAQAQEGRDGE